MKFSRPWIVAIAILFISSQLQAEKIKALIVDGQNNHNAWPKTTMMMKSYLEKTGRFEVDVARTKFTSQGKRFLGQYPLKDGIKREDGRAKTDPNFKPDFSKYDLMYYLKGGKQLLLSN